MRVTSDRERERHTLDDMLLESHGIAHLLAGKGYTASEATMVGLGVAMHCVRDLMRAQGLPYESEAVAEDTVPLIMSADAWIQNGVPALQVMSRLVGAAVELTMAALCGGQEEEVE